MSNSSNDIISDISTQSKKFENKTKFVVYIGYFDSVISRRKKSNR